MTRYPRHSPYASSSRQIPPQSAHSPFMTITSSHPPHRPRRVAGTWSEEEDELLLHLVAKYGEKAWVKVASGFQSGRDKKQCRERWCNHVNPKINNAPFSAEENIFIIESYIRYGRQWARMSRTNELFGRPDNAIKNHFNTNLMHHYILFCKEFNFPRRELNDTEAIGPEQYAFIQGKVTAPDSASCKGIKVSRFLTPYQRRADSICSTNSGYTGLLDESSGDDYKRIVGKVEEGQGSPLPYHHRLPSDGNSTDTSTSNDSDAHYLTLRRDRVDTPSLWLNCSAAETSPSNWDDEQHFAVKSEIRSCLPSPSSVGHSMQSYFFRDDGKRHLYRRDSCCLGAAGDFHGDVLPPIVKPTTIADAFDTRRMPSISLPATPIEPAHSQHYHLYRLWDASLSSFR